MHPHQHQIDLCSRALEAVCPAIPTDLFRDAHDSIDRFDACLLGMEVLIDPLSDKACEKSVMQA